MNVKGISEKIMLKSAFVKSGFPRKMFFCCFAFISTKFKTIRYSWSVQLL